MSMWDQPYRTDTYMYGTAPNDHLTAKRAPPAARQRPVPRRRRRPQRRLARRTWMTGTAVDIKRSVGSDAVSRIDVAAIAPKFDFWLRQHESVDHGSIPSKKAWPAMATGFERGFHNSSSMP